MHNDYLPSDVEPKWQQKWAEARVYEIDLSKVDKDEKFYSLVMFPYPSGDKLHVGHWYQYGPCDSYARFQRMKGKKVFSPMGFDAFGLPAENYAIKTGTPPAQSTAKNVKTMIEQLSRIGTMYDWTKTLNTSDSSYYRWTQWLFLQMHKHELAYRKNANVNWCPSCQTVLANEQVKDGTCERCGTEVHQKALTQWFLSITKYADKLVSNLDDLDWPEKTKLMQRNWIGRSEGVNFREKVKDMDIEFEVYDSIPQTFLAQTFTVIAPEHPLVMELVKGTEHEKAVMKFVDNIRKKKMSGRFKIEEDMDGIFTGRYVENPFGTGDLPIWVCSYVLADYGTGIVNCSAHDERDFAFAKKYNIPLKTVLLPADAKYAEKVKNLEVFYREPDGILQEPEECRGMKWMEARGPVIDYIEKKNIGTRTVNYRLRDWLVSRQRYWGAPIPIVYDPEGNPHPVPEEHLPWMLPTDVEFKPTGKSPLTESKEFVERTEKIFGKGWKPEFDTMDTFVCSSFYYLMYLSTEGHGVKLETRNPKSETNSQFSILNSQFFVDPTIERTWMPVDMYIGGPEHATMHLIYARFVMMALKDFGFVSHEEPFRRLVHQGLITNQGAKMSKSKGNVVSPDGFVEKYGSDVFRMYLMFMGPFTDGGDWNDTGIKGVARFVQRVWRYLTAKVQDGYTDEQVALSALHKAIKAVTESLEKMNFNTAIAGLMELLNEIERQPAVSKDTAQLFVRLLSPIAPHLAEELWEVLGGEGFVIDQRWPAYDPAMLKSDTITIAVQINGKVRGDISLPAESSKEEIIAAAKEIDNVKKYIEGTAIKKEIYVPGKLVSFVV